MYESELKGHLRRSAEFGRARLNALLAMRADRKRKRPGAEEQLALPRIVWPCRTLPFGTSRTGSTGPSPPPAGAVSFAMKEVTPYVVGGGSMSRAEGFRPGGPGSSTCNLRSAAFSNRAAEILGSLVALANLKRIAA